MRKGNRNKGAEEAGLSPSFSKKKNSGKVGDKPASSAPSLCQ
jgi:hypothetical protein